MNDPAIPSPGVLFVCTGNQCRSPMAAALLQARLEERDSPITVQSAGLVSEGAPAPREVLEAMWAVGLDLSGHRSRLLSEMMVRRAGVVIGMTRQHVIDMTVMAPPLWPRCFTFADLLRRAETVGPRLPSEAIGAWAHRLHAGRVRSSLLGLPPSDDIPDPMGGRPRGYQKARDELASRAGRLAELLSPA